MNTIIGIDVSKLKLDCLWLRDPDSMKVKSKKLNNTPEGHKELIHWAMLNTDRPLKDIRFIMEATGVYHEALAYALHEAGGEVVVMNPAQVRYYAKGLGVRTKNDRKDSFVLARFGATQVCRVWKPEPMPIRQLKAFLSRLNALESDLQREQNRLEKSQISQASSMVERSIELMISKLKDEIRRLEGEIDNHFDGHPKLKKDKELLETIPGVGRVLSRYLLATYHSREFKKAGQMAAYIGLIPVDHQSGTSIHHPARMSKGGNSILRAKLYMPAIVASRYNPHAKALYQRLVFAGKAKKSALGAVMRKLVLISFGVLKHQQAYSSSAP